jgi:hypothetical protein
MIEHKANGKHQETLSNESREKDRKTKGKDRKKKEVKKKIARKIIIIYKLIYVIVGNSICSIQLQYINILSEVSNMFQPLKRHRQRHIFK